MTATYITRSGSLREGGSWAPFGAGSSSRTTDPEACVPEPKHLKEDDELGQEYHLDEASIHRAGGRIHVAACTGNVEQLLHALASGESVETLGPGKKTPLHRAAKYGHAHIARVLLERGADAGAQREGDGDFPLHIAATEGHDEVVRVLLDHGAGVDTPNAEGKTPLHRAAKYGRLTSVSLLLAAGADCEARRGDGDTPLLLAVSEGLVEVAVLLLDGGANLEARSEADGETPLLRAVHLGKLPMAELLLKRGAFIDARRGRDDKSSHDLARHGMERLLTVHHIHEAAKCEREGTPQLLACLAAGVDPNKRDELGNSPLFYAATAAAVRALVAAGADPRIHSAFEASDGITPLHVASVLGRTEVINALIAAGAEPDATSISGDTSLHQAALNGWPASCTALLDGGASVDARDSAGRSPLHRAARFGGAAQVECAKVLLARGADPNAQSSSGSRPLDAVCGSGGVESDAMAQLLLQAGATPGVPRVSGADVLQLLGQVKEAVEGWALESAPAAAALRTRVENSRAALALADRVRELLRSLTSQDEAALRKA